MSKENSSLGDNYIKDTADYDRALTALLTPDGKRLSEIANEEQTQVSENVLRRVTQYLTEEHILLLESDGEKYNPRVHRNRALDFLKSAWRMYSVHGPDNLQEQLNALNKEDALYQDKTDYDAPEELLKDIKNNDTDLDNLKSSITDTKTGELFWEFYQPWTNIIFKKKSIKLAIAISDYIEPYINSMDLQVEGQFGDFNDINSVRSRLGLENQEQDKSTPNNTEEQ